MGTCQQSLELIIFTILLTFTKIDRFKNEINDKTTNIIKDYYLSLKNHFVENGKFLILICYRLNLN